MPNSSRTRRQFFLSHGIRRFAQLSHMPATVVSAAVLVRSNTPEAATGPIRSRRRRAGNTHMLPNRPQVCIDRIDMADPAHNGNGPLRWQGARPGACDAVPRVGRRPDRELPSQCRLPVSGECDKQNDQHNREELLVGDLDGDFHNAHPLSGTLAAWLRYQNTPIRPRPSVEGWGRIGSTTNNRSTPIAQTGAPHKQGEAPVSVRVKRYPWFCRWMASPK
jgi:hypothetical protein